MGALMLRRQKSDPPSFLDLPAEIRNYIYAYVFPDGGSAVQMVKRNRSKSYMALSNRLGLISTNRQLHQETTSFLCSNKARLRIKESITIHDLLKDHHREIGKRILKHVSPIGGVYTIYLDSAESDKVLPRILHVDQTLRSWGLDCLELKITVHVHDMEDFASLQSWACQTHSVPQWIQFGAPDIVFQSPKRFQAAQFLLATNNLHRVCLYTQEAADAEPRFRKSLFALQEEVLLFLDYLLKEFPGPSFKSNLIVWIDERLNVSEAEFLLEDGGVASITTKVTTFQSRDSFARVSESSLRGMFKEWRLEHVEKRRDRLLGFAAQLMSEM